MIMFIYLQLRQYSPDFIYLFGPNITYVGIGRLGRLGVSRFSRKALSFKLVSSIPEPFSPFTYTRCSREGPSIPVHCFILFLLLLFTCLSWSCNYMQLWENLPYKIKIDLPLNTVVSISLWLFEEYLLGGRERLA